MRGGCMLMPRSNRNRPPRESIGYRLWRTPWSLKYSRRRGSQFSFRKLTTFTARQARMGCSKRKSHHLYLAPVRLTSSAIRKAFAAFDINRIAAVQDHPPKHAHGKHVEPSLGKITDVRIE